MVSLPSVFLLETETGGNGKHSGGGYEKPSKYIL
jgi:hypothetical protein